MNTHKIDFKNIPWEQPSPNVRMKRHQEGDTQVRLVEFSREFVEPDWCRNGHIGYVLDGRMEVSFGGKVEVFEAGDGVFIPPGEEHRHMVRVLSDKATLVLVERNAGPAA